MYIRIYGAIFAQLTRIIQFCRLKSAIRFVGTTIPFSRAKKGEQRVRGTGSFLSRDENEIGRETRSVWTTRLMVSLTKQRNEKRKGEGEGERKGERKKSKQGKEHLFFLFSFSLPFDRSFHSYIASYGRVGDICFRCCVIRARDRRKFHDTFLKRDDYIFRFLVQKFNGFYENLSFSFRKKSADIWSGNKMTRFRIAWNIHEIDCVSNIRVYRISAQCHCTKRVRYNVSFPYNVTTEGHIFPDKSDRYTEWIRGCSLN